MKPKSLRRLQFAKFFNRSKAGTRLWASTSLGLIALGQPSHAQTSWTGGTNQNWSDATWSSGVPTSDSAITLTPTAARTLTIPNGTAAVGSSLDFSSTDFDAGLTIADGGNLTLSGAITNTGNKNNFIRISNTTLDNAATVLTASSITVSGGINLNAGGSAAGHFSFGNNINTGVQLALDVNGSNGSNWTQTGGTTNVGGNVNYGLSIGQGATGTAQTGIATYNLNGGTLAGARIGVLNGDGNNGAVGRYAMNGVLNFNNGIIQNLGTGNLNVQNGTANSSTTPNTAQWDTSKPLSVVLGGGTAREFQANTGNIIFSPSAVLSGTGNFTKTGTGSLVFTGGNTTNAALNTWSGNSTVTSGAIAVNYSQIAGEAATGGTDTLSGAYSAASRLVLNGGNFTMTGRASASETTATAGAITSNYGLTLPSTAGLVVGQSVSGTNVAPGTYIRQILSGTQIQLSHQTVGNAVINGNTLTFGAASFANTQTINDVTLDATTSTVTVNPGAGTSTTQLDFGNVTGTGGLTKAGTGTLKLTGTLDYTGATAVSAGTLEFANASGTNTLTGNVTGTGSLVKSGAGTTILATPTTAGNSFSGSLSVTGGTLQIGDASTGNSNVSRLTSVSSVNVGSGATLTFKNSGALPGATEITLSGTLNTDDTGVSSGGFHTALGAITFNGGTLTTARGGNTTTFQSYALNGTITVSGSSAASITSTGLDTSGNGIHLANNAASVNRTFNVADVTGDANADLTVSARLLDSSANAGASGLTKTGAGTMVLEATNSYTGATDVSEGRLVINGSISTSTTTVSAGATISGSGTTGALTVASNGFIAPGNSAGVLTVDGGLTLAGTYLWELTALSTSTRGTDFDGLTVTSGVIDLTGATLGLNLSTFAPSSAGFWQTDQVWSGILLNEGNGTLIGNFGSIDNSGWDSLGMFSTTATNSGVDLVWTAIPEPSVALLGGLGMLVLLRRRRRA